MKIIWTSLLTVLLIGVSSAADDGHNLRRSLKKDGEEAANEVDEEDEYDGIVPQSPEDSRAEDVALIAAENGWSIEDTEAHMTLQDAFKGLVAKVKDDNRFLEAAMAAHPGAPVKLYFKNGVPPYFEDDIASFESDNGVVVEIVSTKFSRKDQENRLNSLKNKLRAKGFGDMAMAVIGDQVKITAQKPANDDSIKPTPPGRGGIPPGQVDEVAAEILGLDPEDDTMVGLQLDITEAEAEIGQLEHTRGGRKIYNSATGSSCTTAFSVRQKSTGITGILSAGHCGATMNRYDAEDSGFYNYPESDYSLYHQATYTGFYGDYAWYTTPHWELPYYWASPWSMRSVLGWDFFPSINEQVCIYSRMMGKRTCTRIYSNYVTVDYFGYPPMNRHVAVMSHVTTYGDSGGPWSWNNDAYGVHSGFSTIDGIARSVYSEMYYLQSVFDGDIELLCDGTCAVKYGSQ